MIGGSVRSERPQGSQSGKAVNDARKSGQACGQSPHDNRLYAEVMDDVGTESPVEGRETTDGGQLRQRSPHSARQIDRMEMQADAGESFHVAGLASRYMHLEPGAASPPSQRSSVTPEIVGSTHHQ